MIVEGIVHDGRTGVVGSRCLSQQQEPTFQTTSGMRMNEIIRNCLRLFKLQTPLLLWHTYSNISPPTYEAFWNRDMSGNQIFKRLRFMGASHSKYHMPFLGLHHLETILCYKIHVVHSPKPPLLSISVLFKSSKSLFTYIFYFWN